MGRKREAKELIQSAFLKMACNSLVWSGRQSHYQKHTVDVKALNHELVGMRMWEELRSEEMSPSASEHRLG